MGTDSPSFVQRGRLGAGQYRNDLELDQIFPVDSPFLNQGFIAAFYYLKTAIEIGLDPAAQVVHSLGHHPPFLSESLVDSFGIAILVVFYNHEKHDV
jgi:hypothetical protein